jgi:hypothetical protein
VAKSPLVQTDPDYTPLVELSHEQIYQTFATEGDKPN